MIKTMLKVKYPRSERGIANSIGSSPTIKILVVEVFKIKLRIPKPKNMKRRLLRMLVVLICPKWKNINPTRINPLSLKISANNSKISNSSILPVKIELFPYRRMCLL
jgi:hypothetical protein